MPKFSDLSAEEQARIRAHLVVLRDHVNPSLEPKDAWEYFSDNVGEVLAGAQGDTYNVSNDPVVRDLLKSKGVNNRNSVIVPKYFSQLEFVYLFYMGRTSGMGKLFFFRNDGVGVHVDLTVTPGKPEFFP